MAVDIVQEIKTRTDIVELIQAYVPLKQAGSSYKGLCPFHAEKTPSFTVNRERGLFRCWGCGQGGDCFAFLQLKEGLSFPEAGEVLARRLGLEWVRQGDSAERRSERERLYDAVALAERFFRQQLEAHPVVQKYLEKRGLAPETVESFRLGYAPPGYEMLLNWLKRQKVPLEDAAAADLILEGERGWRDRFVDRVIFPICNVEGRTIAFGGRTLQPDGVPKYLNSRETPIFKKGQTLYGLNLAKKAISEFGFVVAVEGYMDLIALHQAGVANSVASLGTAITQEHVKILRRYGQEVELVMCYDGDGAGMRAAVKNSKEFEAAGCVVRVARLPQGEDPDTYIQQNGVDQFRALLNRAEPLLDYQLNELRSRYNLSDETARLPFVREAARIIAESGSHLVRQEYAARLTRTLDRLADEWYPGDPHRAMQARVALSHEISRLLRTGRQDGQVNGKRPVAPAPKAPLSSRTHAERYLVRAALGEYHWAVWIAERVTPADFAAVELQEMVAALFGEVDRPDAAGDRAEAVRNDPAFAGLASELLLEETPLTEERLEESLSVLVRARMEVRKRELEAAAKAGTLQPGSPEWQELLQLQAELGGRRRYEG